jgi:hypothetical protein
MFELPPALSTTFNSTKFLPLKILKKIFHLKANVFQENPVLCNVIRQFSIVLL